MTPTTNAAPAITDDEIFALKKVALAATPGPWHWINPETDTPRKPGEWRSSLRTVAEFPTRSVGPLPKFIVEADEIRDDNMEANADHIAFANPAAVLALIERLERAESLLAAQPSQAQAAEAPRWIEIYDALVNEGVNDIRARALAARFSPPASPVASERERLTHKQREAFAERMCFIRKSLALEIVDDIARALLAARTGASHE